MRGTKYTPNRCKGVGSTSLSHNADHPEVAKAPPETHSNIDFWGLRAQNRSKKGALLVTKIIDSPNPFVGKFPRKKNNDGAWVSVGEGGCSTLDMVLEIDKDSFFDELVKNLANTLNLSSKNEKLLFGFIASAAKRFDIEKEPVYLDIAQAKKYAMKKGGAVSKSTFQRVLKAFADSGLIATSENKSWFFLNPDIFGLTDEFSVRVKYTARKKSKKCDQTEDFFFWQ